MHVTIELPSAREFKELYDQTGWNDLALQAFESALAGTWLGCTARTESGELVGMVRAISDGSLHAFITELIVAEKCRGNGTGTQILNTLISEARRLGVHDIQLFSAHNRASFYERNGFTRRPASAPGMDFSGNP